MTDPSQGAPEVTPDLRLHPERPRVTRLSRKVLAGLGLTAGRASAAFDDLQLDPRLRAAPR